MTFSRYTSEQIGVPMLIGGVFTLTGLLGFTSQYIGWQAFPSPAVWRSPYFYARWFFFVVQIPCIWTAINIADPDDVPLTLLINYLWPTAIIVFSILFAGVKISRQKIFMTGTVLVILALAIELLGPNISIAKLFSHPQDPIAYALALCAALAWAAYSALSRRGGTESGGGSVIPFFQLTLGLALIPAAIPGMTNWAGLTWRVVGLMAIWAFLQFCAFQVWDNGMRRGSIVVLSLCADFIPWLSLTFAHVLLGIPVGGRTILSAVLLVAGAIITRYGTLPRRVMEEIPSGD